MTVLITGGCKNGKSTFALRQALALADGGPRYYVATMEPCDAEECRRVRTHQAARAGLGFVTLEQSRRLPEILHRADRQGTFLLDSVTALLANAMFGPAGNPAAADRLESDLLQVLEGVRHLVAVSDYIYGDGRQYDAESERFCRGLVRLDRVLAARCDCVAELCLGQPTVHKGRLPWEGDTPWI